jgi:hypothetical protein
MAIPEYLKFKLTGFTGTHVGYVLSGCSLILVPTHYYVSCEESGDVAGINLLVLPITLGLSFITPRTTPHRFRPAGLALFALVLHMLSTH